MGKVAIMLIVDLVSNAFRTVCVIIVTPLAVVHNVYVVYSVL